MKMFKKIFGNRDPLEHLRRAIREERWADVLIAADGVDRAPLSPADLIELDSLVTAAGDGLAELNLTEGDAFLRDGDAARAKGHFSLAAEKARSKNLLERAEEALAELDSSKSPSSASRSAQAHCCRSTCLSTTGMDDIGDQGLATSEDLDPQSRLELILGTYPPEWAERYGRIQGYFQEAFLLANEGRDTKALECLKRVPPEDRDDLFYFERGSLLGRVGEGAEGCRDLERAIALNPDHLLAMEALAAMELAEGNDAAAEERLRGMLERGVASAFSHSLLATILAERGDLESALQHALKGTEQDSGDTNTLLLTAGLLEQSGRLAEAERLLARLSSGGCSGVNIPLAEFWLRQGNNLDKALEAFKRAFRQDPENPRWPFRIAQVYLARGWTKDGVPLLEMALSDPRLDPVLHKEGAVSLRCCGREGKTG